jgi:hypothetical protein
MKKPGDIASESSIISTYELKNFHIPPGLGEGIAGEPVFFREPSMP